MQLKVLWADNPTGLDRPLAALEPTDIAVSIVNEDGAPAGDRHELFVFICSGNIERPLAPLGVSGGTARYRLLPPALSLLRVPQLRVLARNIERQDVQLEKRVLVIGPAQRQLTRTAIGLLGVSSLYVLLVVPQLESSLKLLEGSKEIPILGAATLVYTWLRGWAAELLRRPIVAGCAATFAISVMAYLFLTFRIITNQSLDSIELPGGGAIEPGGYAIASEFKPALPGLCKKKAEHGNAKDHCVVFGVRPKLGLAAVSLLLRSETYGCRDLGIPTDVWRKAGACELHSGLTLEEVAADQVLDSAPDQAVCPDVVSAQLEWSKEPAGLPKLKASQLMQLTFQASQGDPPNLTVALSRANPLLKIRSSMDLKRKAASVLSPLLKSEGGVLDGEVRLGDAPLGTLNSLLGPPKGTAKCWMLSVGTRLSQLLLRNDPGSASTQFHVSAPELTNWIPACWTGNDRPDSGELHVDSSFAPSEHWSLTLPSELHPRRLSVLDQQGKYWGEVRCPTAVASEWHVGLLHLLDPRKELARLWLPGEKEPPWTAGGDHEQDQWIWACWAGSDPPKHYSGASNWQINQVAPHQYESSRGREACRLKLDGTAALGPCVAAATKIEMVEWFDRQRPTCDPERSQLCK